MHNESTLIATIALSLAFAFVGGFLAVRLRLPPLVGYILAGIVIGPFTPGVVADAHLAQQLAEIGVILLMFGVGMHFSVGDLLAVRKIALPGAVFQIMAATAMGSGVAVIWGWTLGAGLIFGLALSVASTVVLLRAFEARKGLDTTDGRISVGWLIVEDLIMILTLVALPLFIKFLSGNPDDLAHVEPLKAWFTLALTLGKVALFVTLMLVFGTRFFPWLLKSAEKTQSQELFTLGVIALALGVAFGSAQLFGVSFALGAFFAGVVINQSDLSPRAAKDLKPLQDAFAVLFFVAVGMLFDPGILVREPWRVITVLAIIVLGKSLAAFAIVLLLRYPLHTALSVSASLAQIGEFSFILAALGVSLKILPREGYNLILAGAIFSIVLNPIMFRLTDKLKTSQTTPVPPPAPRAQRP